MIEELFLGVDIGTGSCKAIARTAHGKVLGETQHFYDVQHPQEGYAEQDPLIIQKAFIQCISDITRKLPDPPKALGLSSAMHSLLLMDKKNLPISPLIIWEDTRSYPVASQLRNTTLGNKIYKNSGTPIHSMSPLCKIAWLRKNEKKLFGKAEKFIGIKEYLWLSLFGTYEIDYSIASATGLFDIHKLRWFRPSLKFCGITESQLSKPVNTTFFRQNPSMEFLQATGLPGNTGICIGASDGCMANAGSQINNKRKAALTIGTSGAVRITTSFPVADSRTMLFNYLLDEKTFVSGGPLNNGGNVIKWMMKEFMNQPEPTEKDYNLFAQQTANIPAGSEGVICLPYLNGERAPIWDEHAAAIWFGVKSYHTKYHLMRAAQEGISFTLKMILESLEKSNGNIDTIYASGGFIHSPAWVQMMADITERKIIISEKEDASATGAAIWAMKASKIKARPDIREKKKVIFPVRKNTSLYRKHYLIFKKIYPLTREYIHSLQP